MPTKASDHESWIDHEMVKVLLTDCRGMRHLTFSLRGAETASKACWRSVPLEAFVRPIHHSFSLGGKSLNRNDFIYQ